MVSVHWDATGFSQTLLLTGWLGKINDEIDLLCYTMAIFIVGGTQE